MTGYGELLSKMNFSFARLNLDPAPDNLRLLRMRLKRVFASKLLALQIISGADSGIKRFIQPRNLNLVYR